MRDFKGKIFFLLKFQADYGLVLTGLLIFLIANQAHNMNTVPNNHNHRYSSPRTSTMIPPSVGPKIAADCEEK